MIVDRIDKILQYALLVAAEEDDFRERQLGPIHLIKYVYLADLAYAERNNGETYTGIEWQFYKFGPWAQEVNQRIEPALTAINARKQIFPSDYEDRDEWVRWEAVDDSFMEPLDRALPLIVTLNVKKNVHKFGKATPELLGYVYSTEPMLAAAPHEYLDFTQLKSLQPHEESPSSEAQPLSKKKKKNLKEKMQNLRLLNKKKLAEKREKRLVKPPILPIHDEVLFNGLEWLDSLAGPKLPEGEIEVVFSPSIWKSPARGGGDVS
ncbi:MAG: Panacea domain-containing protein [Desulfobulbaceae bacterium]|nr:Panacea domain-containing protein [Desulfobulbaceae bacterium]